MRQVLQRPPLELTEASRAARDALYWDRCFDDSDLPKFFDAVQRQTPEPEICMSDAMIARKALTATAVAECHPREASRLNVGSL